MIMTKKEDGTYKQVVSIYRNDEIDVSGEVPVDFKTIDGIIRDYKIKGNAYQSDGVSPDTPQKVKAVGDRTGNLFNKNTITTNSFATVSNPVANKNYYCSDFIPITATTYYFQNAVGGTYQHTVVVYDANKQGLRYANLPGSDKVSGAIAFQSGDAYIRINCYYQTDVDTVMVNIGSTALSYEPYGYKIPVVTRGKNLLGNYTLFSGYYYDSTGTPSAADKRFIRCSPINVKAETNYAISSNLTFLSIWKFKNDQAIEKIPVDNKNVFVFNTGTDCNRIRISLNNTSGKADTSALEWIQLEEGTTATPYEPYHEPITTPIYLDSPLYKIGDYVDSLSKTEEVRVVKELVLTGTDTDGVWEASSSRTGSFYLNIGQNAIAGWAICNRATNVNNVGNYHYGNVFVEKSDVLSAIVINLWLFDTTITLADFKAYLAAQYAAGTPVTVYYVLAEPETKLIILPKIPTLDGTNIIDINTEIKPSNISLSLPMPEIKKILNKEGKILFEKRLYP